VLPLSGIGLIRFDVEDYLTQESDDALAAMLDAMHRAQIPGSYGVVGKKAQALKERGRQDILHRLAQEPSLGFHSWSHSEHPTLAEDLSLLSYEAAVDRFVEREAKGVAQVRDAIRAPEYFTQPGGNWVPEAVEALPRLGMTVYFTDSFNSYLVDLPGPYWYGQTLLYSFPVINPRPFGLGLPGNLAQAIEMVEARQHEPTPFMVMLHPTELVTTVFWDAVNFSYGRTRTPLIPAPLREPQERRAALESFERYLQALRRLDIEWHDAASLKKQVKPLTPVRVTRMMLAKAVAKGGWGPLRMTDEGALSAAEAVFAACQLALEPDRGEVTVGWVGAPAQWEPSAPRHEGLSGTRRLEWCRWVVDGVLSSGRLPSPAQSGMRLEDGLGTVLPSVGKDTLAFLDYVKAPEALHWDWPIFPKNFRPLRLWKDARRLAWTLKPAGLRT